MESVKIGTLNIYGVTSRKSVGILEEYVLRHDFDILFLQELTCPDFTAMRGYVIHHNIGTSMRDTAIVTRNEITFTNVSKLPSGRAIVVEYRGTWLINICAPTGTARRQEGENSYNNELPHVLRTAPATMIIEGNFDCLLENSDTTGHFHYIWALVEVVHGFALKDT
jgi:exonuclease III